MMDREHHNLNQRPIPDAALRDADSVEMLRVWIAERGLHCSIKVGMYREGSVVAEEEAWGTILADVAKHVANALESGYSTSAADTLRRIAAAFVAELEAPTSEATGAFVEKH